MRWNLVRRYVAAASMLWATAALADPIAFVVAMKGTITVTPGKGGAGEKAALGRPLERGDKVTVGPASTASLFFSDGNVVELGAGSSMTVGGHLAAADPKRVGPGSEVSAEVFGRVSKFITSKNKQAGLIAVAPMRSSKDQPWPMLIAPRKTFTLSNRPSFLWRSVRGATRYRVTLGNDEGDVWNREAADTTLAYPEDAKELAGGGDFTWSVQAMNETGPLLAEESTFHVMAEGEAEQVHDHLAGITQAAGDTTEAGHYLAGSYLVGRELYTDAVHEFAALCEITPEAPGPHQALGEVYAMVGLSDLANQQFERAKELTKK